MRHIFILKIPRLEALTDGIFTIAMTILILNVSLPLSTTSSNLFSSLKTDVFYTLFIYAGSFIILGTYWVGINFHHGLLSHINRSYLWINIIYLMLACIVPFSANLLAHFPRNPTSISFYAINLILISLLQLIAWWHAQHYQLTNATARIPAINQSIYRRICIAPAFYLIALILAYWNTYIAFITLVIPPIVHIFPGKVDEATVDR